MGARFQPHGEARAAHASALQLSKLAAERFSGRMTRREQLAFLSALAIVQRCAPPRRPITVCASHRRSLLCVRCRHPHRAH